MKMRLYLPTDFLNKKYTRSESGYGVWSDVACKNLLNESVAIGDKINSIFYPRRRGGHYFGTTGVSSFKIQSRADNMLSYEDKITNAGSSLIEKFIPNYYAFILDSKSVMYTLLNPDGYPVHINPIRYGGATGAGGALDSSATTIYLDSILDGNTKLKVGDKIFIQDEVMQIATITNSVTFTYDSVSRSRGKLTVVRGGSPTAKEGYLTEQYPIGCSDITISRDLTFGDGTNAGSSYAPEVTVSKTIYGNFAKPSRAHSTAGTISYPEGSGIDFAITETIEADIAENRGAYASWEIASSNTTGATADKYFKHDIGITSIMSGKYFDFENTIGTWEEGAELGGIKQNKTLGGGFIGTSTYKNLRMFSVTLPVLTEAQKTILMWMAEVGMQYPLMMSLNADTDASTNALSNTTHSPTIYWVKLNGVPTIQRLRSSGYYKDSNLYVATLQFLEVL